MNDQATPQTLMAKTEQAIASARTLLKLGDVDGACNRAYYAVFNAVRAALLVSGAFETTDIGKTHKGVLIAFNNHFIKTGRLPKELGRFLKHAEAFRYAADYGSTSVKSTDAQMMVQQAETFIVTIRDEFFPTGHADGEGITR